MSYKLSMEQVLWFGWFRADIISEYALLFWRGLQLTILIRLWGQVHLRENPWGQVFQ